jgi:hypothetical protein
MAVFALLMIVMVAPIAAQTATPAPTATPGINVPTGTIFSQTNSWISTFAPIAAIGIGITVALAVLGYIGKQITKAFRP